jgi:xylose isomerase
MFYAHILAMDTFALGLIKAAELIEDGRIDTFIEEKYSSFNEGIGKKIINNETTLEELCAYACEKGITENPKSGRQEYLQTIVNQILF